MSKVYRFDKTTYRYAITAIIILSGLVEIRGAKSLEWESIEYGQQTISVLEVVDPEIQTSSPLASTLVESHDATFQEKEGLNWTGVSDKERTEAKQINRVVVWKRIEPSEVIAADELELEETTDEVLITNEPTGPTFANDKAIWRDDTWHPQISGMVPVGFSPTGRMVSASIWGIDCVTGAGYCASTDGFDDYIDQLERIGEAQYNLSLGFGDAEKLAGLTITSRFEETSLPIGNRNTTEYKNIFSNYYIGAHLSRNLSPDTAFKVGIDNWLDIRECVDCGFAKSAYGIITQRIRLRENQNSVLPNAYLTLGVGNGQFRPLDELIRDAIRQQRAEGCATPGYTPDKACSSEALTRASLRARSYGQINPIGAVAVEAVPGLNLIGEWSGRNLNAGFSVRPFEDLGLILTGMWESILSNCDYGCTVSVSGVPDGIDLATSLPNALTQRARFSFQAALELKF